MSVPLKNKTPPTHRLQNFRQSIDLALTLYGWVFEVVVKGISSLIYICTAQPHTPPLENQGCCCSGGRYSDESQARVLCLPLSAFPAKLIVTLPNHLSSAVFLSTSDDHRQRLLTCLACPILPHARRRCHNHHRAVCEVLDVHSFLSPTPFLITTPDQQHFNPYKMIPTFASRAATALLIGGSVVSASYTLDLTSSGTNTPIWLW